MVAEELVGVNKKEQLRATIESRSLADLMDTNIVTVRPDETLNDVIKKMTELDLHEMPISPEGKYLSGVVSFGTLIQRKNLSITTKAETVMVSPHEVTPKTTVTEVAEILVSSGFRQIPVVEDRRIRGTVSRTQLLKIIQDIRDIKDIPVSAVMSTDVQTVHEDDQVMDAVTTMRNLDIRVLPVVDSMDRLSGIIGIKDVANYNWRERNRQTVGELIGNNFPIQVKVNSVAIYPPATVSPSTTLGEAARIMTDKNISSLPVVENGTMQGIITKYDMIELLASFRQRNYMYMQITGLGEDDRFAVEQMERVITQSIQKIAKMTQPMLFTLHVGKYNHVGLNYKYSLHGRLTVDGRLYIGTSVDWDLIKATTELMKVFERQIIERKEEIKQHRKYTRNIGHS